MIVVAGPRIDPASLPAHDGLEVRGVRARPLPHLAACDLAVVQGGLTTSMELTANGRPFLDFPLRHHFEQNFHVRHRLERYGAGRPMDFATAARESPPRSPRRSAAASTTAPSTRRAPPGPPPRSQSCSKGRPTSLSDNSSLSGVQTATNRAPSAVASVRCAGLAPTTTERAGSTPCTRANASGRPGSGGRHQQTGGPPPCGQRAPSTWRHAARAERLDRGVERRAIAVGVPVEDEVRQAGWSGAYAAAAAAATKTAACPLPGARSNATRSTAANPSSSDGGSSSRNVRICDVGEQPGPARALAAAPASAAHRSGRAGARRD